MATKTKGKVPSAKMGASGARVAPLTPGLRPLPAKSRQKARTKFQNFSLSRFSPTAPPENFVAPKSLKDPAAIQALNRTIMKTNLTKWPAQNQPNTGMTLALGDAELQALLPSYKPKAGTVDLSDLLAALKPRMTGTQFYTNGAPALVQSTEQARLRTTAQEIIQSIKNQPVALSDSTNGAASDTKPQKALRTRKGRTGK